MNKCIILCIFSITRGSCFSSTIIWIYVWILHSYLSYIVRSLSPNFVQVFEIRLHYFTIVTYKGATHCNTYTYMSWATYVCVGNENCCTLICANGEMYCSLISNTWKDIGIIARTPLYVDYWYDELVFNYYFQIFIL